MTTPRAFLVTVALTWLFAARTEGQVPSGPDTVVVPSGALRLRALLWRPEGRGPFPAVLFNHGSGHGVLAPSGDHYEHTMEWQAEVLGPVFARHGYVYLYPLRRGTGLSAAARINSSDRWDSALAANGEEARNRLQLQLLETVELDDALAGLAFLRTLPDVDTSRIAVAGHSFGGSLTVLVAEHDSGLRAAVVFSGSAKSWPRSRSLRERLLQAAARLAVPVFFISAANDFSVAPEEALADEMSRRGKPYRPKIYPPVGNTAQEGHGFVHLRVATWESDVFSFLDERLRR